MRGEADVWETKLFVTARFGPTQSETKTCFHVRILCRENHRESARLYCTCLRRLASHLFSFKGEIHQHVRDPALIQSDKAVTTEGPESVSEMEARLLTLWSDGSLPFSSFATVHSVAFHRIAAQPAVQLTYNLGNEDINER